MSISGVATQQLQAQQGVAISGVKQAAKSEQAIVNLISDSAAPQSGRGQNVDISV